MRSLKLGTVLGIGMMSCLVSVPFLPPVISEVMIGIGCSGVLLSAICVAAEVEHHMRRERFMQGLVDERISFLARLLPTLKTGELKDLCLYMILRYAWDESSLGFDEFTSLSKSKVLEALHNRGWLSINNYKEEVARIFSAQPQQLAIIQDLISRYEQAEG